MDGMDTQQVEDLGDRLRELSIRIRRVSEDVRSNTVHASAQFSSRRLVRRLSRAEAISAEAGRSSRRLSGRLKQQALEQRRASRAITGGFPGPPGLPGPPKPLPDVSPPELQPDVTAWPWPVPPALRKLIDEVLDQLPTWLRQTLPPGWVPGPPFTYLALTPGANPPQILGWIGPAPMWIVPTSDPAFLANLVAFLALWRDAVPFMILGPIFGFMVVPWNPEMVPPGSWAADAPRPLSEGAPESSTTGAIGTGGDPVYSGRMLAADRALAVEAGSASGAPRNQSAISGTPGDFGSDGPSSPRTMAEVSSSGASFESADAPGNGSIDGHGPYSSSPPSDPASPEAINDADAMGETVMSSPSKFVLTGKSPLPDVSSDQGAVGGGPPWALLGLVGAGLAVVAGGLGAEMKKDRASRNRLKQQIERPIGERVARGDSPAKQLGSHGLRENSLLLGIPASPRTSRPANGSPLRSSLMNPLRASPIG